jgi:hypothetical protein
MLVIMVELLMTRPMGGGGEGAAGLFGSGPWPRGLPIITLFNLNIIISGMSLGIHFD